MPAMTTATQTANKRRKSGGNNVEAGSSSGSITGDGVMVDSRDAILDESYRVALNSLTNKDCVSKILQIIRGDFNKDMKIPYLVACVKDLKQTEHDIGCILKDPSGKQSEKGGVI